MSSHWDVEEPTSGQIWLAKVAGSEGRKKVAWAMLNFLLRTGGFRRKKIPWKSRLLQGRLIDPPIWSKWKLSVSDIGIYCLSLAADHPLDLPDREEWELGDHILAYLAFGRLLQRGEEPPPIFSASLLVQLLAYTHVEYGLSPSQWESFIDRGGDVLMVYLEDTLARRWATLARESIHLPPGELLWYVEATERLFAILITCLDRDRLIHLVSPILLFLKNLFPYSRRFLPYLRRRVYQASEETGREVSLEVLGELPQRIEERVKSITGKHRLEQTSSEILFLEKYHKHYEPSPI